MTRNASRLQVEAVSVWQSALVSGSQRRFLAGTALWRGESKAVGRWISIRRRASKQLAELLSVNSWVWRQLRIGYLPLNL